MRTPRPGTLALALAATALVLSGCSPTPSTAPSASADPSASTPTATATATVASAPPVPDPASPSAVPKPAPSSRATTPAPSTAGDLGAASLPKAILGFTAKERPPAENEFVPNGTWVHAVDAHQAATQALPLCSGNTGWQGAGPQAALMGSYADAAGRPGNALALSFGSADQAAAYADAYRQVLRSCGTSGPTAAQQVDAGADHYAGRRQVGGQQWTELVGVRDRHVVLAIVQDDGRSTPADATGAAKALARP